MRLSPISWQREAATATFFEEHALPVVEDDIATFAVRAEADSVYLRHRINIWPHDLELTRIAGTDVWFLTIKLELGARIEYQFEIIRGGQSWRFNGLEPDARYPLLIVHDGGDYLD